MATKLGSTGIIFPDLSTQTTATSGLVYATKLLNSDYQNNVYRKSFAIMSDGSVRAWGVGSNYGLGDGGGNWAQDRSLPTIVAFPPDFPGAADIQASRHWHTVCLDKNGQLWTWGQNDYGQCGNGTNTGIIIPVNVSLNASGSIYGKTITKVIVPTGYESATNTFVLCSDGTMHGCGYNAYGQLGNGNTTDQYYFVRCGTLTGVTDISAGRENYCTTMAVAGGQLYSWGRNGDYQFGNGTNTNVSTPTLRNSGSLSGKTIVKCWALFYTCIALASDGTLHGAGNQSSGQFGIGNTTNQTAWVQINTGVSTIHGAGFDYPNIVILKTNNTVWVAGSGNYINTSWTPDGYGGYVENQLGNMTSWTQMTLPTTINSVAVTPTKILRGGTGSYNNIYVLMSNGWVYSCGRNADGQTGTGYVGQSVANPLNLTNPGVVKTGGALVQDISVYGATGETNLMILTKTGEVRVAGYGANHQNGNLDSYSQPTPGRIRFN